MYMYMSIGELLITSSVGATSNLDPSISLVHATQKFSAVGGHLVPCNRRSSSVTGDRCIYIVGGMIMEGPDDIHERIQVVPSSQYCCESIQLG